MSMSKKITVVGNINVPFSCEIELDESDIELLLSSSSFIKSHGTTEQRYLFSLLYDKIKFDEEAFDEIDIDFVEDEEGYSLK